MILRAITIYQPWASLIIAGAKLIETRDHDKFRSLDGKRIGIHAGKDTRYCTEDRMEQMYSWIDNNSDGVDQRGPFNLVWEQMTDGKLPFGCMLGSAKVEDHHPLGAPHSLWALSDCSSAPGWGLLLGFIQEFDEPIPVRGHQGIWGWKVPDAAVPQLAQYE